MNVQHVRYDRDRDRRDRGDHGSWQNRLRSRNSSSSDPAEAVPTTSNKIDAGRDVNANLSEESSHYSDSFTLSLREEDMSSPGRRTEVDIHAGLSSALSPSSSFLACVVCGLTPPGPPLHGCDSGHLVCASCRDMGGGRRS